MVNQSATFGLSLLVTLVGSVVMLYGVSLTSGEELTAFTIAGGVLVLVAVGILTGGLMGIDDGHDAA